MQRWKTLGQVSCICLDDSSTSPTSANCRDTAYRLNMDFGSYGPWIYTEKVSEFTLTYPQGLKPRLLRFTAWSENRRGPWDTSDHWLNGVILSNASAGFIKQDEAGRSRTSSKL